MFTLPKISVPSLLRMGGVSHPTVELASVEVHDIETAADKRPRTLKHLLKANHANYSVIYNNLTFHNHVPHILGSAYVLGGTAEHLNNVYEKEVEHLEPWRDSPGEISKDDWRDFLGKKEYQRAFVDFFEDQLVSTRYNLQAVLEEFLLGGKEPLINNVMSGLAHSGIHLGYAYELQSTTVAIEALALGACFYSPMHKYIDDPKYTKPSLLRKDDGQETGLLELLDRVRVDKRFDGIDEYGTGEISKVFEQQEEAFLEYWNGWEITKPTEQFESLQATAVAMLMQTPPTTKGRFDFFFVHALTSSHAIRILLPLVPGKFHVSLLRQWWLFTLAIFIAQARPVLNKDTPTGVHDGKDRRWEDVVHAALDGPHSIDAHYVKALRALKVCAETYGDENGCYLQAALRFVDEFDHWGGF